MYIWPSIRPGSANWKSFCWGSKSLLCSATDRRSYSYNCARDHYYRYPWHWCIHYVHTSEGTTVQSTRITSLPKVKVLLYTWYWYTHDDHTSEGTDVNVLLFMWNIPILYKCWLEMCKRGTNHKYPVMKKHYIHITCTHTIFDVTPKLNKWNKQKTAEI